MPLRARLKASLPSTGTILAGGPLWGILMALSAATSLYAQDRLWLSADLDILGLYFVGGLIGWVLALPFARFCAAGRRPETRFAAWLLWLAIGTIGVTAGLFALQYRSFYSQWHAPFLSRIWVYQLVFTSASAVYQFAVIGLRLFMPLGFMLLIATSAIMARRMR